MSEPLDAEPELTDEELAKLIAERDEAQKLERLHTNTRIDLMVRAMSQVFTQFEANNTEILGAVFTHAHRVVTAALEADPDASPYLREMALRVLLNTADPRPADANIQIAVPVEETPKDDATAA